MKVLLCGAGGFVGRHIEAALRANGWQVRRGVSATAAQGSDDVAVDFARDTSAASWLPRVQGMDAVVNAVGILRASARRPMQQIHAAAPVALFDACAQAGVRRVIHVSALGIEGNVSTYASTKRRADHYLLELNARQMLDAVVLRPSVVFGPGGASSELFLKLARSPLLPLPRPVLRAQVQPLHVLELAQVTVRLLSDCRAQTGVIDCVGPQAVPLAQFIASLRTQLGAAPARVLTLPDWLTRLSALAADLAPVTPWGRQALSLLSQDNVGNVQAIQAVLGRRPTHFTQFIEVLRASA